MAYQFHGLFYAKVTLGEEQQWYYLTHSWLEVIKRFNSFPKFESKHNGTIGVQTLLLQGHSPALYPLCHGNFPYMVHVQTTNF